MFRTAFRRLLALDDPPERTALAFAIGVFIAFTPLLGLHTILATLIAFLFRFNKIAIYTGTFVNNPFLTLVPITLVSYGPASARRAAPSDRRVLARTLPARLGHLAAVRRRRLMPRRRLFVAHLSCYLTPAARRSEVAGEGGKRMSTFKLRRTTPHAPALISRHGRPCVLTP